MYRETIRNYLQEKQDKMIQDLCQVVRIPSITRDPDKVTDALYFILRLAEQMGFSAASHLNGAVGVIEMGAGNETLGILGHVDVVAPGDLQKWNSDPFEPVIENGRVYGRGTTDDKGPVIAVLYAMKAAAELGLPMKKKVQLILGTKEEEEWTDMEGYVKNFPLPDYGFTPDGEFPICNIEKGVMEITLKAPIQPTGNEGIYITGIKAGLASNVIPDLCVVDMAENVKRSDGTMEERFFQLKSTGISAHSCQPENGENAILNMAETLKSYQLLPSPASKLMAVIDEKFQEMDGAKLGVKSESQYVNGEFVHCNTFAPTIISTENGDLRIGFDVRFAYGADENAIRLSFEKVAAEIGGKLEKIVRMPAVYVGKDRPFIKAFAAAYEDMTGLENKFSLAYGGSYAKAMPNIVSWGPIFPGEEDTCHAENEYISVKSLLQNAEIFAQAISKIIFSEAQYK